MARPTQPAPGTIPAGRLFGIRLSLEPSLLFLLLLVTFGLGSGLLAAWHPGWSGSLRWLTALSAASAFVLSILLHELSHALVARAFGLEVRSITLFMFGGVSSLEREPPSPGVELLMAIIGPITSLLIGVIAMSVGASLAGIHDASADPLPLIRSASPLATLLLWLGPINVGLAIFNLIPGFPLDGGRVLRALLWMATGDLHRATRWATLAGRVVGGVFIAAGLAMALGVELPLLGRGLISGLWLLLIGWLLSSAARNSYTQMMMKGVLEGVPVSRLMRQDTHPISPEMTVATLIDTHVLRTDERAFPVVDAQGALLGMVGLEDVRKVSREDWGITPVTQIMTPLERLILATPEQDTYEVIQRIGQLPIRQVPVVRGGALIGLLHLSDVLRWLEVQSDRDLRHTTAASLPRSAYRDAEGALSPAGRPRAKGAFDKRGVR